MTRNTLPGLFSDDGMTPTLFQSLQKEMNHMLDRFRGYPGLYTDETSKPGFNGLFPAIDLAESDDAVEVTAEVPGVKEEDLDVSISGQDLVLKGEKRSDHEEKEKDYHRIERSYGSFRRQIPLGFKPAEGAVKAKFSDGVLSLHIAKPPETRESIQKVEIHKT